MHKYEGALSFFKGLGTPLTTVPVVNMMVFATYEIFKRAIGVKNE